MERHNQIVQDVADKMRDFYKLHQPYRVFHGSSSTTRRSHGAIRPGTPSGDGISRDHSWRGLCRDIWGKQLISKWLLQRNETVNFAEIILGNGDIIRTSREEHEDLFHGAAGASGTLGLTTLMQVRLVEAKQFVKTTYHRVDSVPTAISTSKQCFEKVDVDYVDGILYSKDHGVVITGELTNIKPGDYPIRTFSNAGDLWFYLHVKEQTESLPPSATITEYIPLSEYLFRYDRAAFWVGRQGYTYFKIVPFNRFFRWLLDDYSHTRTLYYVLHASRISDQFVVQYLALPYDTAEAFVD
ncbi:hypothetical protein LZL87_008960 [Fusarium oxysporum]|nr:hypothetical protein LZL87_008960 [Fusarium oxysporum]